MARPAPPRAAEQPLVRVVDDDPAIREAMLDLLRSVGIDAMGFASTPALLEAGLSARPGCLVLDVRLPGISGLDLQAQLAAGGDGLPIIFMTGHGDIPMSVRAMKAGAVDFLTKPVRDQDMLDAVAAAIATDRARREARAAAARVAALAATLTRREREVFDGVARGLMNKQIAGDLGITEITVKLHRGNVMRKMEARTLADLIRKAGLLAEGA
ncbi:response regulator transcription factor [Plastoroseomonas hellenica]|uniref:response regulator transcription factor n=1 Tax=Plastoroseomonas hellenica TaxID=2687306 RepID=UPI001BA6ED5D|nr:response regulator [Plastoroseomonas hellenica]MBR0646630.1 response regulator transcription factor [Plastoroseomonas hellenica]